MKDKILELDINDIHDFLYHPFKIMQDSNYEELKNSIIENGVLVPVIVRKKRMENMK